MAESEEIEEFAEEEAGQEGDVAPPSETTEAKKRAAAKIHADIAKICEHEASIWAGSSSDLSPALVGTVAKFVTEYAEILAKRLPDFARHGKRKVITSDDVLLFLKPHPDFHSKLVEFNDKLASEKEAKKRKREENKAKNPPKAKGTKEKKQKDVPKEKHDEEEPAVLDSE